MASVACSLACEALKLSDLHSKPSAGRADMADMDIVTTPTPWADDTHFGFMLPAVSSSLAEADATPTPWADGNHFDFMLPAVPSALVEPDAKVEQELLPGRAETAYPFSLEATLAHPTGIGFHFVPVQCVYLSSECLPLQHGLAESCLPIETPDVQQNNCCILDRAQIQNDQDRGIGYEPRLGDHGKFQDDRCLLCKDIRSEVLDESDTPHYACHCPLFVCKSCYAPHVRDLASSIKCFACERVCSDEIKGKCKKGVDCVYSHNEAAIALFKIISKPRCPVGANLRRRNQRKAGKDKIRLCSSQSNVDQCCLQGELQGFFEPTIDNAYGTLW